MVEVQSANTKWQTVALDFDGVIHSYTSGWQGFDVIPDPPVDGIKEFIDELREIGYRVVIYSSRCCCVAGKGAITKWLDKNGIYVDAVQAQKPPAICYVDDRAIPFTGSTEGLLDKIQDFKSWTEKY